MICTHCGNRMYYNVTGNEWRCVCGNLVCQQTTHYCPHCSTGVIAVAMTENYTCYACSCGHVEAKPHLSSGNPPCNCVKCRAARTQRATSVKPSVKPMTPTGNIRIWWDASVSAYRMASPYNASLVDTIKTQIPVSDRSYDPATKIWTFVERQLAPLQALLKMLNMGSTVVTRQQAEASASQQTSSAGTSGRNVKPLDTVIVEFVRLLPLDAAKKAYRAAAMDLHPDKQGGRSDKMQALNMAWDRIQKEVYGGQ